MRYLAAGLAFLALTLSTMANANQPVRVLADRTESLLKPLFVNGNYIRTRTTVGIRCRYRVCTRSKIRDSSGRTSARYPDERCRADTAGCTGLCGTVRLTETAYVNTLSGDREGDRLSDRSGQLQRTTICVRDGERGISGNETVSGKAGLTVGPGIGVRSRTTGGGSCSSRSVRITVAAYIGAGAQVGNDG